MCLPFGIKILLRLLALDARLDDHATLVLVVLAEADGAGGLRDDRGLLRTPCLEQLRHPRQTAGDVPGLGALGRNTRDHVARLHGRARIDRDDGVDREQIARIAAATELVDLVVLVLNVVIGSLVILCGLSFCLARLFIVVEAVISIRNLPAAAYVTPDWTQIFPHV